VQGIRAERAKPSSRPSFPGTPHMQQKTLPGEPENKTAAPSKVYVPKLRGETSDVVKRKFIRAAFDIIRSYFEEALHEFSRSHKGLEFDFQHVTAVEFTAEIFLNGKSATACRIWQGGMLSENSISYAEGRHTFGSNSCNEILSVNTDNGDVTLSSMMGGFGRGPENIDLKHMSGEAAAEYLWRRFVTHLEHTR